MAEQTKNVHLTKEQFAYVNHKIEQQYNFMVAAINEARQEKPDLDKIVDIFEKSSASFEEEKNLDISMAIASLMEKHPQFIAGNKELDKLIPLFQERYKPEIKSKDNVKLKFDRVITSPVDAINSMIDQNGKTAIADIHGKPAQIEYLTEHMKEIHGDTIWLETLDHNGKPPGISVDAYAPGTQEGYAKLADSAAKAGKKVIGIDTRTGLLPSAGLRLAICNHEWNKRIGSGTGILVGGFSHFVAMAGGKTDDISPMPVFITVRGNPVEVQILDDKRFADFAIILPSDKAVTVKEIDTLPELNSLIPKAPSELPLPPGSQLKR